MAKEAYADKFNEFNLDGIFRNHNHLDFVRDDNKVSIELHWALTPVYWQIHIDFESMEERLETAALGGTAVRNMSPQDQLLILSAHGAKHWWTRLRWVCDIAELIDRRPDLPWDQLLNQAKRLRCRRLLFLGLFLAKDLLDAPLPTDVWQQVHSDPVVPSLAAQACATLRPRGKLVPNQFDHLKFFLMTRENWRDRLRYFWHDHLRGYARSLAQLRSSSLRHALRSVRPGIVHGMHLIPVLLRHLLPS